jgi:hypothetical protein
VATVVLAASVLGAKAQLLLEAQTVVMVATVDLCGW